MNIQITYRHKKPGISMRLTKDGNLSISASYFTTKAEIQNFIHQHKEWIEKALYRQQAARLQNEAFFGQLEIDTPAGRRTAVVRLKSIITPYIEKYCELMNVRVEYITLRNTKKRWGSCNSRRRSLNFSIYLLLLPEWCIEHVVVHELAHLIEPNHSKRFYAIMDKYFQRWREARSETRRIFEMHNALNSPNDN